MQASAAARKGLVTGSRDFRGRRPCFGGDSWQDEALSAPGIPEVATMLRSGLLLLLCLTGPAAARANEAKPNMLTPQEIAEGWLLLFDGETTFGWQIDGDVAVKDGVLVLGGSRATKARSTAAFQNAICSFHLEARWAGERAPSFEVPDALAGSLLPSAKEKFI